MANPPKSVLLSSFHNLGPLETGEDNEIVTWAAIFKDIQRRKKPDPRPSTSIMTDIQLDKDERAW